MDDSGKFVEDEQSNSSPKPPGPLIDICSAVFPGSTFWTMKLVAQCSSLRSQRQNTTLHRMYRLLLGGN
jgi:hypothetical protein